MTDALKVGRAYTFLTGCNPVPRRSYLTGEIFFHRRHTGVNQQQGFIVVRNKRKARQTQMPL